MFKLHGGYTFVVVFSAHYAIFTTNFVLIITATSFLLLLNSSVVYVCNLDEGNGCQEAAGVSSAAVEMTMDPFPCHYEKTCHETTVGLSHDVPPPIVTEGR